MPLTKSDLVKLMGEAGSAGASGENPYVKGDQDRKTLVAKEGLEQQSAEADISRVKALQDYFKKKGLKVNTKSGSADISVAPTSLAMMLTPAQDAAEKDAGKRIADFEGGGKTAAESNLGQIQGVQQELQQGKKDTWDRRVGGLLENHPTLMSMFAPTEKARRDSVQNAMLTMLHDAGIPRPTQWDIQRVFGQVYDPAADDKTNMARLQQQAAKIAGHTQAVQGQADQYHKTGYATLGQQPQAQAPQQPAQAAPGAPQAPPQDDAAEFQNFYHNVYKKMKNAPKQPGQ